jgi:hypothetical protein
MHAADLLPQPIPPRLRDYVLEDYPPRAPLEGRLHAASLLKNFLREQNWLDVVWPMVERVRAKLGHDETVWGIKTRRQGPPSVEFYWYNHNRNTTENPKSVHQIADLFRPFLNIPVELDERLPYLMCSLELDAEVLTTRQAPPFRLYLAGRRNAEGYDGVAMRLDSGRLSYENSYWFYPQPAQRELLMERIRSAWRLGGAAQRKTWIQQELMQCHCICFAMKAATDALYYSRVPTAALLGPLKKLWPQQSELLEKYADQLDHLCWDLGVDLGCGPNSLEVATVQKVGLYGVV